MIAGPERRPPVGAGGTRRLRGAFPSHMDRRRLLRSPWTWIVIALILIFAVPPVFRGNGGFTQVDTSAALNQIRDGNYSKVLVNDKEQTLDITLNNAVNGNTKITAS